MTNFAHSLRVRAAAELELRRRERLRSFASTGDDVGDWRGWLRHLFAPYVSGADGQPIAFASRHEELYQWVWSIKRGERPAPFVAVWPRGGGKSTSAELACAALAARQTRKYGLYICETQDQADDHIANVAAMLESPAFEALYPDVAARKLGKYGNSKGWRRNRLRTGSGFTLDAIGLDVASRGIKVEEDRPDLFIVDDIDGELDSPATVEKKIKTLTRKLLPAGSREAAVLAVQNLIHPDSIFSRLVDGRADFLTDRTISGPYPAIDGLAYEQRDGRFVVTDGTPTWAGQDLGVCQAAIDQYGISSFLSESQQQVQAPPGGMFDHLAYRHCRYDEVPDLVRVVVWVDPAVTETDRSDACGIQADGLAPNGDVYRLYSWEQRSTPQKALLRAIEKALELRADYVGVETDQGGDTWRSVFDEALRAVEKDRRGRHEAEQIELAESERKDWVDVWRPPAFASEKAGAGQGSKTHRAAQMLADYERGRVVHVVGTHATLEAALHRFPRTKPYDLVDAAFWAWHDLREGETEPRMRWLG